MNADRIVPFSLFATLFVALVLSPIAAGCADDGVTWIPIAPDAGARSDADSTTDSADDDRGRGGSRAATRTLAEAGVVPNQFSDLIVHTRGARTSVPHCQGGEECEVAYVALRADGTYVTRGFIGVGGSISSMTIVCDEGWWTEAPGEITLTSCGGSTYQADWHVISSEELQLGEFGMKLSSTRVFDTHCRHECDPFWQ